MSLTDPVALLSQMERQSEVTASRGGANVRRASGPPLEILWHERRITQSGCLTTIRVPTAGTTPAPDLGPELAAVLGERWTGRLDLTPGARVLSVTAQLDVPVLGQPLLVLRLVTDTDIDASQIKQVRMANELRRAVRDLERGYALPTGLTLAAA